MDVNDTLVLEMINCLIATNRLNKKQTLHIVNLASISNNIQELKDNMNWETLTPKH